MKAADELWVLTRMIGGTNPMWDCWSTMIGSPKTIRAMFDLSHGVPFGWRLLKGKRARRWLRDLTKEELRFQRDRRARAKAENN
jgi:hypothetical protein